jgi:hypothetical protein
VWRLRKGIQTLQAELDRALEALEPGPGEMSRSPRIATCSGVTNVLGPSPAASLFDSLLRTACDTTGRSVTQARQTAEYMRHVLTLPDSSWQGTSISS